jgi:RNA-directed DNA polymerase
LTHTPQYAHPTILRSSVMYRTLWPLRTAAKTAVSRPSHLVVGFESRTEAECFLEKFRERLANFGLELHPEKTRLIEFGQFAERNRKRR